MGTLVPISKSDQALHVTHSSGALGPQPDGWFGTPGLNIRPKKKKLGYIGGKTKGSGFVKKNSTLSAFGVDHADDVSKGMYDKPKNSSQYARRQGAIAAIPGVGTTVSPFTAGAGARKGRGFGVGMRSLGRTAVGTTAGQIAGAAPGLAMHSPKAVKLGAFGGGLVGGSIGAKGAARTAKDRGDLKFKR